MIWGGIVSLFMLISEKKDTVRKEVFKLKAKTMKKWLALFLTLVMAVSLVACAGGKEPAETNTPDGESSVSEETSALESRSADEPQLESDLCSPVNRKKRKLRLKQTASRCW